MQNVYRTTDADRITIKREEDDATVAIFINNEDGRKAYEDFKLGLSRNRNFNLYGQDGEFIAGDLSV